MNAVPEDPPPRKTTRLRRLLESPETEFILEAHNGLSARIVEEAGFKGIWASGLALSAQFGVRDNNEASWTQVVDMLEFMSDATSIPILLDGDTGYGNFNNLRRLVQKLEQRGIAGVCIEDKLFPKTNSFIGGERQPLADVEEFCGKIRAGKDAQTDPDFRIVARVEALIAGWGLDEALRRAEAYHAAGADAILIHSKLPRPDEVLAFAERWAGRCPLVIVPTKYYSTPTEVFREAGVSLVIWANHLIRAAARAMQEVAREIHATESLLNVEDRIVPVDEIFRLQGAEELAEAEKRYFAGRRRSTRAVILGASRGAELASLTEELPKVMLPVAGKPLLQRLVETFKRHEVNELSVVTGYRADRVRVSGVRRIENPAFTETGELASLACAAGAFGEDVIVSYGDLLIRSYILGDLLESDAPLTLVVDTDLPQPDSRDWRDLVWLARDSIDSLGHAAEVRRICGTAEPDPEPPPDGRWIGMLRARGAGVAWLREALDGLSARPGFETLGLPDLLAELLARGRRIRAQLIHGHWLDVNRAEDLLRAADFARDLPAEWR
jgi:phosphoenolpyruvate phosphomutase